MRALGKYYIQLKLSDEEVEHLIYHHWQLIGRLEEQSHPDKFAEIAWRKLRVRILGEAAAFEKRQA